MSSTVNDLLLAIDQERGKRQTSEDDDFVVVQQQKTTRWSDIFTTYFVSETSRLPQITSGAVSDDDLVFYVERRIDEDSHGATQGVSVFRHHDVKRQPKPGSPGYDWEETINLNLVLHQFEYIVTGAICLKQDNNILQISKRFSTRVYASPSRRNMEGKGTEEKISYPSIYFSVDNFEDIFSEAFLSEGQRFSVEMIAKNPNLPQTRVIFSGALSYEGLKLIYADRESKKSKTAQKSASVSFSNERVEFLRLREPNGKGHAQIAVSSCQAKKKSKSSSRSANLEASNREQLSARNFDDRSEESPEDSSKQRKINTRAASMVNLTGIQAEVETAAPSGSRLNRAFKWMRGSRTSSDENRNETLLKVAITFLRIPCQCIIEEILHPTSRSLISK